MFTDRNRLRPHQRERLSPAFLSSLISIFRTKQEIRYVHGLNALIVSSRKFICRKNIFGVIIVYFQQSVVFPFFRLFRTYFLRVLNINLFVLPC